MSFINPCHRSLAYGDGHIQGDGQLGQVPGWIAAAQEAGHNVVALATGDPISVSLGDGGTPQALSAFIKAETQRVALQALGYKPAEVSKLVSAAAAPGDSAEAIIRKALKSALRAS